MKYIASCSFGKDSLAQIIVGKVYQYDIQFKKEKEKMLTDIHEGVA